MVYSFMFGPNMKQACPMCTSFIDSLNGAAPHFEERANLASHRKVSDSPHSRVRPPGEGGTIYACFPLRAPPTIAITPGRIPREGSCHRSTSSRGAVEKSITSTTRSWCSLPGDKGQNQRHIDMAFWPLWVCSADFTPEGRGADWFPRLSYKT